MPSGDPPSGEAAARAGRGAVFHPYCEAILEEIQRFFEGREIRVFPTWAPRPENHSGEYDAIRIQLARRDGESDAAFAQERYRMEGLLDGREKETGSPQSGARLLVRQSEREPAIPIFGRTADESPVVVAWDFIAYVATAPVRDAGVEPLDLRRVDRQHV